jgi:hypothetical protein
MDRVVCCASALNLSPCKSKVVVPCVVPAVNDLERVEHYEDCDGQVICVRKMAAKSPGKGGRARSGAKGAEKGEKRCERSFPRRVD